MKAQTEQPQDLNLIQLAKIVSNEDNARALVEAIRWPDGIPVCPKCGEKGAYKLTGNPKSKRPVRNGVWKCKSCRKQFTVTVGTIFEDSHVPLSKWLMAYYLFCSAKKSISAHELHRDLDIKYQTAWFMFHRIRHSMGIEAKPKLEGTVEVDETYVGGKPRKGDGKVHKKGRGTSKVPVVALVQRSGNVRTRVVADVTAEMLKQAIRENVAVNSTIMTDEWKLSSKNLAQQV